ncbi:hypothetical protein BSFP_049000 [Burkholderia stabilis]|uniref:Uncharacterized protein n=1 Tax=Burkholderia stabilis TaxID=95485 RepID=A0A1Y1BQ44_9BURK|nr:hypothetical protein BSFP_049000 [Burkholderia stabilis]
MHQTNPAKPRFRVRPQFPHARVGERRASR